MKGKRKAAGAGKLEAAVDALKKKMAMEAVQQHGTLEAAAKDLGLTAPGLANMLRRYGVRFKVKTVRTLELQGPK